jgi:cytoskeletal protein RodZ
MEIDLVEARRNSGVSLAQIAETTRISMRFLEAIEAGEFEKLPGGVFAVNYVRQYARCIGYDEDALVEQCKRVLRIDPELRDIAPLIEATAQARAQARRPLFRLPLVRIRLTWTSYARRRARSIEAGA